MKNNLSFLVTYQQKIFREAGGTGGCSCDPSHYISDLKVGSPSESLIVFFPAVLYMLTAY